MTVPAASSTAVTVTPYFLSMYLKLSQRGRVLCLRTDPPLLLFAIFHFFLGGFSDRWLGFLNIAYLLRFGTYSSRVFVLLRPFSVAFLCLILSSKAAPGSCCSLRSLIHFPHLIHVLLPECQSGLEHARI